MPSFLKGAASPAEVRVRVNPLSVREGREGGREGGRGGGERWGGHYYILLHLQQSYMYNVMFLTEE